MQIPMEALDFIPGEDVVFFKFSDGKKHRRIFAEPQEYSQSELIEIDRFKAYIRDNDLKLPEECSDREAYKHLVATGKHEKAYEGIVKQFESLKAIRPIAYEPIEFLLNSGIFYFHRRDKNFRPI
mmetsp:Transcript_23363/g.20755  ORF Transcript_23363/g.20755 Transcript_23363/m.20755 type:complete len:125 (+) Transcript_23363:73-447(+)